MTYISAWASRLDTKAICSPVGDHGPYAVAVARLNHLICFRERWRQRLLAKDALHSGFGARNDHFGVSTYPPGTDIDQVEMLRI